MNEHFAADPQSCNSALELRYLLSLFGVFTGRFLAEYPDGWKSQVEIHVAKGRQLEQKRVQELWIQARKHAAILKKPSLDWVEQQSWTENASRLVDCHPARLDGLIVSRTANKPSSNTFTLDELDLPPTAGERIPAVPEEYVRVARTLLLVSSEIAFVDPYFNLNDPTVAPVASALFTTLAKGRCKRVMCFARASNVLGIEAGTRISDLRTALSNITSQAFASRPIAVSYGLFDDDRSRDRMHDRYLLSAKGGIQLGQGFKQLPPGRKIQAEPISAASHAELAAIYLEGRHNMRAVHTLSN